MKFTAICAGRISGDGVMGRKNLSFSLFFFSPSLSIFIFLSLSLSLPFLYCHFVEKKNEGLKGS